jgi:hypothetical protein
MGLAFPAPISEPNQTTTEPHSDFEALQEENKQLKDLVVLSKLVIKYVVQQH